MKKILILNGSPRSEKSNSKHFAEIFKKSSAKNTQYYNILKTNHSELCSKINSCSDLLFVFPLYADSLPVTLLDFLKSLEVNAPKNKPVISVLINCGFLESNQNDTAVRILNLFCRQNGYTFGSVLKIGSGEAILSTPFKILAKIKIKALAKSILSGKYKTLSVTMPISKKAFIKASTKYWIEYGKKNGCGIDEMDRIQIE